MAQLSDVRQGYFEIAKHLHITVLLRFFDFETEALKKHQRFNHIHTDFELTTHLVGIHVSGTGKGSSGN